jgi:S-DNA-T family DNA segregation ATPase FtsK/SpoIIIE
MLFRKKRRLAVEERSVDSKPFEIPQIQDANTTKTYQRDHFVSPIFGTFVKDEIVIPNPTRRQGDLDKQLDGFRTKPKMTKETMKERYGSEYPEFDLIEGRNLNEALDAQMRRRNRPKAPIDDRPADAVVPEKQPDIAPPKASGPAMDAFFDKETAEQTKREAAAVVKEDEPKVMEPPKKVRRVTTGSYQLPGLSLLERPAKRQSDHKEWIQNQIDILNRTFEEFSIGARVKTHTKGPTVTRYEIELESGVYVKKVTGIADNIKMALAAKEIRMEAPIPGKNTVGIEVPNEVPETVHFIDIIDTESFRQNKDPLTIALGLDIDGNGVYTSIVKMPHGLVAGATGSGKSVCINTILMSLLFRYGPDELKLMLIDPKMVELSSYNDLPHLITPVITDAKIATAGLKWAVEEMERRFLLFREEAVRDITSYNNKAFQENLEHMPYVVIVVDELADLMMIASGAVEEAIMRLTQKARAAGIHLIIATQRPSTDVVKGTIKSNIPTRIAFMVSSYIDSMTIIDSAGADKLLGRGDMLFAESGKPNIRVQGAFISDEEIHRVNQFIRDQRDASYLFTQETLVNQAARDDEYDELLSPVAHFVVDNEEASINKISKEFRIGFNRAQKIVEQLFDLGIVSDNVGSKARSVLVTPIELNQILGEES